MYRIQILRDRIAELTNRPEPPAPTAEHLAEHARLMGCSVEQAERHFQGARNARREQTLRIIAQLEAELAAERAKWYTPIQQRQPRKK